MSLLNKNADEEEHIDRISDLPSNVIDGILQNLDIREIVRTSILSSKWRYMWTYVPRLEFYYNFFEPYEDLDDPHPVVSKIITDVLMRHNGPIYKFYLFIPSNFNFKITPENFDMLSRRGIKHLKLVDLETARNHLPYDVFSCKELTKFTLGGYNLSILPTFSGFKRLLKLALHRVTFESSTLESLISGCPLLEKLIIRDCNGFEYFHISAPSLKVLLLYFNENVKSICLKKAKNLFGLILVAGEGCVSGLIKSLPKNMQKFYIDSNHGSKIHYANIIPPSLLKSSFNSIKDLNLGGVRLNDRRELLYIVSVLKSAPCLVELVVKSYGHVDITQVSDRSEELECSSCCLNQLKTVNIEISATTHQHAMSLIQFILANSTSLKTLAFDVHLGSEKLDASMLLHIAQDLLLMKRASQSAQVKFIH